MTWFDESTDEDHQWQRYESTSSSPCPPPLIPGRRSDSRPTAPSNARNESTSALNFLRPLHCFNEEANTTCSVRAFSPAVLPSADSRHSARATAGVTPSRSDMFEKSATNIDFIVHGPGLIHVISNVSTVPEPLTYSHGNGIESIVLILESDHDYHILGDAYGESEWHCAANHSLLLITKVRHSAGRIFT